MSERWAHLGYCAPVLKELLQSQTKLWIADVNRWIFSLHMRLPASPKSFLRWRQSRPPGKIGKTKYKKGEEQDKTLNSVYKFPTFCIYWQCDPISVGKRKDKRDEQVQSSDWVPAQEYQMLYQISHQISNVFEHKCKIYILRNLKLYLSTSY